MGGGGVSSGSGAAFCWFAPSFRAAGSVGVRLATGNTSSVEARGGARGRGVVVETRAVSGLCCFFKSVTFDVNDDGS